MAAIDITSAGGASLNTGVLQLQNGVPLDSTLRNVADQNNTTSPLKLSTTGVQIESPLRITTSDASGFYLDAEDSATNNRFSIKRDPSSQEVTLDFASNPSGSTTLVGAIRTYRDGTNLSNAMSFIDDGSIGIGTNAPIGILHLYKSAATTRMVMDGDGGQSKIITYRTGGLQRFGLYVNNTAESGSNAGSNFAIRAYNDAGTLLSTPFFINRATGNVGVNTLTGTAKLQVVGSGSTSATTSLLVQNSSGTQLFKVADDGSSAFSSNVTSTPLTSNAANSNTIAFELLSTNVRRFRILATSTLTTFEASNTGGITTNSSLNVGGSTSSNASAILQADSTTKGFLPPRMTSVQKNLIATPAIGLMIFDTDLGRPCFYNGAWVTL